MFTWDPAQYSRFEYLRLRPALDLLSQVHHNSPRLIYDIGTGRGQIARLMADRWSQAEVIGTDTSADMLREAAAVSSRVRWIEHDVREWDPPIAPDVIYSNAVLHWVPDHDEVIVRLVESLRPGGVLAIQMPLSWAEPSHRIMRDALAAGDEGRSIEIEGLMARLRKRPVAEPEHYHELLRTACREVNVWRTVYYQQLQGEDAVLEWVKGTALRPVLGSLDDLERSRFIGSYRSRLREAYPPAADGTTLYPFPRVFIVGNRG